MRILYHLTIPSSSAVHDAVVQEVKALQTQLGGEIVYLNPAHRPGSLYPERLYGLHRLPYLRRREATVRLHHVYNPHLLYFPYLRWLRRPIVYSVTAGLRSQRPGNLKRLGQLAAIVVSNERDRETLQSWGLRNTRVIRPGIEISRFRPTPPPPGPGFTLLAGSAPWTETQFNSKGVEALLAAAEARPDLRLVFLWRGLLTDEMKRRVIAAGVSERVTVLDYQVDVNAVLGRVHASIALASDVTLVKAFPHSLLESLAAGRPVLVSRSIPMADFVEQTGCGVVVERVDPLAVLAAMDELAARYRQYQEATLRLDRATFSFEQVKRAYSRIYQACSPAFRPDA